MLLQRSTSKVVIKVDHRYLLPAEVDLLLSNASKAKTKLGRHPKIGFNALIRMTVNADLRRTEREKGSNG